MSRAPWVGFAALVLKFAIPFLSSWMFEDLARSGTGCEGTSARSAVPSGSTIAATP
jgi:hypothetical protein